MDEDKLKQHLDDLSDNIDEILESAAAVRGKAFANAVCVSFEGNQMSELIGQIAALAEEQYQDQARRMGGICIQIMASMMDKACGEMSEELFDEALKMGAVLFERRAKAMDEINKDLNQDD